MKRIICFIVMLSVAGCGFSRHMGNENLKPEMVAQVVKGKSTKQDVLSLLGPPQSTSTRSPLNTMQQQPGSPTLPVSLTAAETWSYWSHNIEGSAVVLPFYAQTSSKSSNYIVSIFFDDKGTVLDISTMANNY